MEDQESLTQYPADLSDLDNSFTSSTSSYATTFASTSSARSSLSLSLNLPSFSSSSTVNPLPHSRSDPLWSSLRAATVLSPDGLLHLRHLQLLRPLGSGDLARVFHCRLRDNPNSDFALKVIDLDASTSSKKDRLSHVRAEAHVLAALDHPFLPTLYARLDASHYACFLIDYCPGGDLHSLLRRQPRHRLPLSSARFYAAEVLLALEYLHALGFLYRDLKPENVLLRADGHIMLSDFDLCFYSPVSPALHRMRCEQEKEGEELEFVAEPDTAFSRACVGTHEYLAPEIVSCNGHGNGVDWWAFGVFLYELLYGLTPFKGSTKEATLRNIVAKDVRFPEGDDDLAPARDLITRLLVKDPKSRMGCSRGAAEIKKHPFFDGVTWALIRSCSPPHCAGRGDAEKETKWGRFTGCLKKLGFRLLNKKKREKIGRLLV
ncbi:hypothetical protein J5N97_030153 [Dioscorea zingiberensis]|uniref:non-specific serine/threonine protein kinase n=1 Tax=Dioscorea zingiberensis TaxID=325984 RepID=A0A9D5H3S6_9LILI|nr:hypothetical protein J5N97_030153 [Dioscorea zingiberensis]